MRHSNQINRGHGLPVAAVGLALWIVTAMVAACGSSGPSGSPPPTPTPLVTPDPHLHEPVTADQIYIVLQLAKLGINPNNANLGHGNPLIVKQINADIGNWPLRITQYITSAARERSVDWKPGEKPVRDDAPYGFAALNVVVEFGPIDTAGVPRAPDTGRQQTAATILSVLDPLLWPILQHSVTPFPAQTLPPVAGQPSTAPSARPSTAPSARPSGSASKAP
jgi:hypothetical protein